LFWWLLFAIHGIGPEKQSVGYMKEYPYSFLLVFQSEVYSPVAPLQPLITTIPRMSNKPIANNLPSFHYTFGYKLRRIKSGVV
jgi:hypothetical protein